MIESFPLDHQKRFKGTLAVPVLGRLYGGLCVTWNTRRERLCVFNEIPMRSLC